MSEETVSSIGDVVDGGLAEDLNLLTDDQLAARLRQQGVDVGPIVGKKLFASQVELRREHS